MLYIGNFSYSDDKDDKNNYCLLPSVVSAEDADDALRKFADMFEDIKERSDLLEGAHEIYLDSLVELDEAPEDAVLTQWQKIVPAAEGLCSITSSLPDLDDDSDLATSYVWESEDYADDDADLEELLDDEEYIDTAANDEPFIEFE
jgi:hypothetical protein